jgi:DNA-binding MarR family transcriptional regulator
MAVIGRRGDIEDLAPRREAARDRRCPTSLISGSPRSRPVAPPDGFRVNDQENGMTGSSCGDDDSRRLLELTEEVTRIASALADLSLGLNGGPGSAEDAKRSGTDMSVAPVDRIFHARRARARYLPQDLFAEPAWDMLLDLLRCELRGRRLSTSDLCMAASVPGTTALRWIAAMVQRGLLIREPDRNDGRRVFITLAPDASAALRRYFAEVIEGSIK